MKIFRCWHNSCLSKVCACPLQHLEVKLNQHVQYFVIFQIGVDKRVKPVCDMHVLGDKFIISLLDKKYLKKFDDFNLLIFTGFLHLLFQVLHILWYLFIQGGYIHDVWEFSIGFEHGEDRVELAKLFDVEWLKWDFFENILRMCFYHFDVIVIQLRLSFKGTLLEDLGGQKCDIHFFLVLVKVIGHVLKSCKDIVRRVDIVVHDVLSDGVIANGKDEVGCRQAHSNEIVKQPHFFDLKAVVDNISYFMVNVIFWSFLYLDEFQFM